MPRTPEREKPLLSALSQRRSVFNTSWQEERKLKRWQSQCSYTCLPIRRRSSRQVFDRMTLEDKHALDHLHPPPQVTDCELVLNIYVRLNCYHTNKRTKKQTKVCFLVLFYICYRNKIILNVWKLSELCKRTIFTSRWQICCGTRQNVLTF